MIEFVIMAFFINVYKDIPHRKIGLLLQLLLSGLKFF
jgi:hypothetical protein